MYTRTCALTRNGTGQTGECSFGERCSFAHSQEEIDEWSRQRDEIIMNQVDLLIGVGARDMVRSAVA